MPTTANHTHCRTLVASVAGGPARQYRVQFLPEGESTWRLFGLFRQRSSAQTCAQDLSDNGIDARIVAVRIYPTAA
jgi:hypothetical protein